MFYIHFFPFPLMIGVLVIAIACFLLRKHGWGYVAGLTLFGLYALALTDTMFFPFRIPEGWPVSLRWDEVTKTLANSLNLIPFIFHRLFSDAALGRISYRMVFWQTVGNILITIPFGLGTGFLTKVRGWHVLLIALGTGLTLEGLQLFFLLLGLGNMHVIDINDTLLNAIGVLAGYGLFWAITHGLRKVKLIQDHPA